MYLDLRKQSNKKILVFTHLHSPYTFKPLKENAVRLFEDNWQQLNLQLHYSKGSF